MDFISGFKWALPQAFSDAVYLCCFEEGDILYDTKKAYDSEWSEVKNDIEYFLQVRHPARGYSTTANSNGVFEANWNSEVRIELYKNHKMVSIGQIHTTQGKLYSALWKGDLNIILNENTKNPEPPINIQQINKDLDVSSNIAKSLSERKPTFVMAIDSTNPIAREKYLKIKNQLFKNMHSEPIILTPREAGFSSSEKITPTIKIAFFITQKITSQEVEELVKKAVYVKSKNTITEKFRISAHGRIFPDTSTSIFIYQDAKGNITKREITAISSSEEYIQGICKKSNNIRTFRKDRILEYITDINEINSKLEHFVKANPAPRQANTTLPDICFTGFKKEDKDKLIKIATEKNLTIRSSVTKKLSFLCCGYNAGPKKIETARKQGVIVLNEKQFIAMLETGELPET